MFMISFKEFFLLKEQAEQYNIFYHVCKDSDFSNIMLHGLLASVGSRSSQLNEEPGVFLFRSKDEAEDGVMNWLGDEFGEDEILDLLEVKLPSTFPLENNPDSFEVISRRDIPASFIKLIERNF